uniref:Uncharacterized protein n=1 Tax=Anguilla anguilla TaxID=7936 RepID=A0A0E9RE06_ANGAN
MRPKQTFTKVIENQKCGGKKPIQSILPPHLSNVENIVLWLGHVWLLLEQAHSSLLMM